MIFVFVTNETRINKRVYAANWIVMRAMSAFRYCAITIIVPWFRLEA
jgi:hypothetical protein